MWLRFFWVICPSIWTCFISVNTLIQMKYVPSFKYSYSHLVKVRCDRDAEALNKQTSNQNSIISFLPHRLQHKKHDEKSNHNTNATHATQQYGIRNTRNPYTIGPLKMTSPKKWPFPHLPPSPVTVKTIEFAIWNNGSHRFWWPPSLLSLVTSFLNGSHNIWRKLTATFYQRKLSYLIWRQQ